MNIDDLYDIFPEYSQYGDSISRFLDSSEDIHQISYLKKLRQQYPDFKEKDVHLCMLVRLKESNATLVNIFNVGESAVKKRKSTLKKHGFHITDADITLEQIIENFWYIFLLFFR